MRDSSPTTCPAHTVRRKADRRECLARTNSKGSRRRSSATANVSPRAESVFRGRQEFSRKIRLATEDSAAETREFLPAWLSTALVTFRHSRDSRRSSQRRRGHDGETLPGSCEKTSQRS